MTSLLEGGGAAQNLRKYMKPVRTYYSTHECCTKPLLLYMNVVLFVPARDVAEDDKDFEHLEVVVGGVGVLLVGRDGQGRFGVVGRRWGVVADAQLHQPGAEGPYRVQVAHVAAPAATVT